MASDPRFGVVVAAGGQAPTRLADSQGVRTKGQLVVAGTPCLTRVANAVAAIGLPAVVVGGPEARELTEGIPWEPEREGAVANFRAGVVALPEQTHFVFLPADAPFLTPDSISSFVRSLASLEGEWLAVGLCSAEGYRAAFPECPKRSVRTREGRFHTGAFYAGTRGAFIQAVETLNHLFHDRRSQFAMAKRIGIWQALRFAAGKLSVGEAESAFYRVLGVRGVAVPGCDPRMVVDIDDAKELAQVRLVAHRLSRTAPPPGLNRQDETVGEP